jgi:hypothetical protein
LELVEHKEIHAVQREMTRFLIVLQQKVVEVEHHTVALPLGLTEVQEVVETLQTHLEVLEERVTKVVMEDKGNRQAIIVEEAEVVQVQLEWEEQLQVTVARVLQILLLA